MGSVPARGLYLLAAARRVFSERQPQRKRVDGWGNDCWLAPARPRNGGVPSTARPSHLGGRASCTWRNTQTGSHWQSALATKEICKGGAVFASNRRRPQRDRRPQTQKLTSACARRQCLPLSRRTHHRPLSPPICLVCTAGGTDGFIAKLPPAGVLTRIKILP